MQFRLDQRGIDLGGRLAHWQVSNSKSLKRLSFLYYLILQHLSLSKPRRLYFRHRIFYNDFLGLVLESVQTCFELSLNWLGAWNHSWINHVDSFEFWQSFLYASLLNAKGSVVAVGRAPTCSFVTRCNLRVFLSLRNIFVDEDWQSISIIYALVTHRKRVFDSFHRLARDADWSSSGSVFWHVFVIKPFASFFLLLN